MKPVDFEHSNCILGGEVPANRAFGIVLTRWQGCWRERLKFLLFGKLWLAAKGDTLPPLLLTSDRAFRITNPPAVSGEVKNPIGGGG
jgi:hypothetical protein